MTELRPRAESHETELRYEVESLNSVTARVAGLEPLRESSHLIRDEWFIPSDVASYERHESWLATGRAAPVRVRSVGVGDSDSWRCWIEVKRPVEGSGLSASVETRVRVESSDRAGDVLAVLGYALVAVVEKSRREFLLAGGIMCCLDDYGTSGRIVEIESTQAGENSGVRGRLHSVAVAVLNGEGVELREPVPLRMIRAALRKAAIDGPEIVRVEGKGN